MRTFSTKIFLLAIAMVLCIPALRGQTIRQAIIANGGVFGNDNFATIAAWDPQNNNYFVFDSIPATSVQDVVIEGNVAYVAADSTIRAYDLDNFSTLATTTMTGVRKLALWNDKLIATRGFPVGSEYVKVLDKASLVETATIGGLSDECEGVVVVDDTAYVAVPGNFLANNGYFAIIDLPNANLLAEIDLDTLGTGISRLFYHPATNSVYSLNTLGFGSATGAITSYAIGSRNPVTTQLSFSVGSIGGLWQDKLYSGFDGNFAAVELPGFSLVNPPIASGSWAAGIPDTTRQAFYLTETDYFSYGLLRAFDANGNQTDSLAVGISPEALAVDYRVAISAENPLLEALQITAYPNPTTDILYIDSRETRRQIQGLELIDLAGRVLVTQAWTAGTNRLDLGSIPAGSYFLRLNTNSGAFLKPIIKQ